MPPGICLYHDLDSIPVQPTQRKGFASPWRMRMGHRVPSTRKTQLEAH